MTNPWHRHEAAIERVIESSIGDPDDPGAVLLRETFHELKASTTSGLVGLLVEIVRVEGQVKALIDGSGSE